MEPRGAEYFCAQVLQKDVSGRLQAGEELLLYLGAPGAIPDLEDDPSRLAKTVDALTGWVGSSNYRDHYNRLRYAPSKLLHHPPCADTHCWGSAHLLLIYKLISTKGRKRAAASGQMGTDLPPPRTCLRQQSCLRPHTASEDF